MPQVVEESLVLFEIVSQNFLMHILGFFLKFYHWQFKVRTEFFFLEGIVYSY